MIKIWEHIISRDLTIMHHFEDEDRLLRKHFGNGFLNPNNVIKELVMAKSNYDGNSIAVLEGLEAVRRRPGMYIGSVGTKGLNHLIYEIVDNSVDEHLAGYCNEIKVTLEKDGSATISDNGRGIPVDINDKTGRPAVEVVFTVLHAGGKFGDGGYKISGWSPWCWCISCKCAFSMVRGKC